MKNRILNIAAVFCMLLTLTNCNKEDGEPNISSKEEYETYLQDEMDAQNIPAMSVTIFKENTVIYEKYLGQSNVQQNLALAGDHKFLLASVSKVVTATALLQLHEDGKFALGDKINDYLDFKVNVPNQSKDITFKMLLTHTSGIADGSALDNQYYDNKDSPVELDFFLKNYLVPGGDFYNASQNYHNFEPGTQHEYTNIGNALIGVLVEQISGKGFNTYCKENIFTPLGMQNTHWRLDETTGIIVTPYNYANRKYEAIPQYTFTDYPNGGLRSTGTDMFKFLRTFIQEGKSNGHELLKQSTVSAMITPQIPAIDQEVGLHLFIMNAPNNLWGHDGGEKGVATIMAFNPVTKVGAIILTNQGDAELEEILVQSYKIGLSF